MINKMLEYCTRKTLAQIVKVISMLFYFPAVFFNFYLVFQVTNETPITEKIPTFILIGIACFAVYLFHRLLIDWVKYIKTPLLGGLVRGIKRAEMIIYLTTAFYFTTKAYPNEMVLQYLISVNVCFILSAVLEGVSLVIAGVEEWNDGK